MAIDPEEKDNEVEPEDGEHSCVGGYAEMEARLDIDVIFGIDTSEDN